MAYGRHVDVNQPNVESVYGRFSSGAFSRVIGKPALDDLPADQLRDLVLNWGHSLPIATTDSTTGTTDTTTGATDSTTGTTDTTTGTTDSTAGTTATDTTTTTDSTAGTTATTDGTGAVTSTGDQQSLDLAQGQISHVVLDVGGFLGIGTHSVAVPIEELQVFRDGNNDIRVYLPWTQAQLEALPEYDADNPGTLDATDGATTGGTSDQ